MMDKLRMSLAAAMTLGFKPGRFYRDARLHCINLLMDYPDGCEANCAYCGLSSGRDIPASGQTFIRIQWPRYFVDRIINRIEERREAVKRICLAMVTHPDAPDELAGLIKRFKERLDVPISLLVTPTYLQEHQIRAYKENGADRFTVAYDAATEDTFRKYRGEGADSFLDWEQYWRVLDMALPVFGKRKVGGHLIVGLGETEEEMTAAFQNMRDRGGQTHLFSFYPEPHSILEGREPPPMEQYRRMQLARFIIDKGIAGFKDFRFGEDGRLLDYGIESSRLKQIVDCREPFMTSGCPGEDGMTACNRPFANCRPGPQLRNYPFQPDSGDMARIKRTLYNKEITGLEQDVEQPHQEA